MLPKVLLLLSCLVCTGCASGSWTKRERWTGSAEQDSKIIQPRQAFANLLVTTNPGFAFKPSGSVTGHHTHVVSHAGVVADQIFGVPVIDMPVTTRAAARVAPPKALLAELGGTAFVGFLAWAFQGVGPSQEAEAALKSPSMSCSSKAGGLLFEPVGKESLGLIVFYAGAKIAPASYAPLAQAVVDLDASMLILQSPPNGSPPFQGGIYAVKPPSVATVLEDIKPSPYDSYVIAGHSIGGLWAIEYCQDMLDAGTWPQAGSKGKKPAIHYCHVGVHGPDLTKFRELPFASTTYFYATNDWTLKAAQKPPADAPDGADVESIEEYVARIASSQLPTDSKIVRIDGGNHAQYGSYGLPGRANGYLKDEIEASADMPEKRQHEIVAAALVAPMKR